MELILKLKQSKFKVEQQNYRFGTPLDKKDLEQLLQTKQKLRNKFLKSPLSNTKQYVKHYEDFLNLIWKTYLEKKYPTSN